ncbi:LysR family transcriptional regulator [Paracoccus kondratievae]|uniref:LysR family transcriptional regulator n=1 Tax=Paracoccus kondratievae TaxID=135740 RepID=A0AAD3RRL3_9RHOB|nr:MULTISPECIES: LysR family transcriptional regulator [Paracoccus]QFQ86137.1 LysR family transcriptional regulator [Paracoccus kondratievae]GLK62893.1 LysR family transcriptional regulator [Paracoccus kondratievae]SMG51335.1 DNA-binding transcriptional regulator, LysR family [Paracoccus sp. J56]
MTVTLRQLRYFLVLAEELHFGRAAERLHISQPPLSASLKQLEQKLGFELLQRNQRGVRLTPAGRLYAQNVRQILAQLEAAEVEAAQTAQTISGRLTVAFVPSMLFRNLDTTLKEFHEAYVDVELQLREMNTIKQIEGLMNRSIDLGFVHSVSLPDQIAEHVLETERLMCCVPRDHRLARRGRVRLADLEGERVLLFSREFAPQFYDKIVSLLAGCGNQPYSSYHIQHWFTVVALVGRGMGVSLVPQSLSRSRFSNVRYIEVEEAEAEHRVSMLWHRDNRNELVTLFSRFAAERVS